MVKRVTIVEVGPRDGLQNEQARVSTAVAAISEFSSSLPPRPALSRRSG